MAQKRVIAYFMHEDEQAAANARLGDREETESYIIGDIDEAAIPELEEAGLLVQPLEEPGAAETPGRDFQVAAGLRRAPSHAFAAMADVPAAAPPADRPTYYLVTLRGPLLESRREELTGLGVELLERVPPDSYKALLSLDQVRQVEELPFVTGVRLYAPEDTGPVTRAAAETPAGGRELVQFDIRLQPKADPEWVLAWLDERRVPVAGASRRKIRAYFFRDEAVLNELSALSEVERVEEYIPPRLFNDVARQLLGIDGNNSPDIGLTGQGQVVGVADTGFDETHPDFQGRTVGVVALGRTNDASDPDGHGTHVAGSVLGDGTASNGQVRGTAPGAELFFQSLLDPGGGLGGLPIDLNELFEEAYQAGVRIHNNSWGAATRSMYTMNSIEVDEFVGSHRDMLIVIAAGNEGTAAQPVNSRPGFVDWLSIGSPASAKNALVVGASRTSRSSGGISHLAYEDAWPGDFPAPPIGRELVSGDAEAIAAFSSRGPCDDRRIKPDLVAPGTDIASAKSSRAPLRNFWGPYPGNGRYAFLGGTSMATPLVSGCAALVREYYVNRRNHDPSAALLKATLINGTRWLSGLDAVADHADQPNFHQGFGCLHVPSAIPSPAAPALRLEFRDTWQTPLEQFSFSGQRYRYSVEISGGAALRICLAWTDLPDRGLQNSLALMVQHLSSGRKWTANANVPLLITRPDPDNNVHLVRIENPPPGQYLIQIFARNLLKPNQDYALVVTGELTNGLTSF